MKLTYFGHAGFGIELNGTHLVFDPFITGNPKAPSIDINTIKADYVLLTHAHSDHVTDAEAIARNNDATIISNYEITNFYGSKKLKAHPLNHGGKKKFDFGTVKYVNAIHTSTFPDGSNGGDPGGFVVWSGNICFYHAGDTALTMDMKLIPMTCPKLDFAIFPIGDNFTMGYEDAAIAAEFVDVNMVIGCHYDTFGYIEIDKNAAIEAFSQKGKQLILPEVGSTINLSMSEE